MKRKVDVEVNAGIAAMRASHSCSTLEKLSVSDIDTPALPDSYNWTLMDTAEKKKKVRLPLQSFNHIAREVLSLEKSKSFYEDILGFMLIPRPPFDCEGYWLWGYGLSLHLVETTNRIGRMQVKRLRIKHFSDSLPRVDHIAFITNYIDDVKATLDKEKVFYKHDKPEGTGIEQLFFFDPDGNVIEVSNCAPAIGETSCQRTESAESDNTSKGISAMYSSRSSSSDSTPIFDEYDDALTDNSEEKSLSD